MIRSRRMPIGGRPIDVNCDLAESAPEEWESRDRVILPWISSANVACGAHGGSPGVIQRTLLEAARLGVAVGAHPGPWDKSGMGRVGTPPTPEEIPLLLGYQLGALKGLAEPLEIPLQHVKPHGLLYHAVHAGLAAARAFVEAVRRIDAALIVVGQGGSPLLAEAARAGLRTAAEGFVDRAYQGDGRLVPRDRPDAVYRDPARAVRQALELLEDGSVTAVDGTRVAVRIDTLCLHGDTPGAPALARAVRQALEARGYTLLPMGRPAIR